MYTYKCYFHPKEDSVVACRGCKLPVCTPCQGNEGFCPECVQKRKAVQQLRQFRSVVASRTQVSSTTARLRLALKEAGPDSTRRRDPASPNTRPLDPIVPVRASASAPEPLPQTRRYNPDLVAYRPVGAQPPAPAPRFAPATRPARPASKPAATRKPATAQAPAPTWTKPFAAGLGAGVVLVMALLFAQTFMPPAKASKPLYQSLSTHEMAIAKQLLGDEATHLSAVDAAPAPTSAPEQPVGWAQP